MRQGQKNRAVGSHDMNEHSSRSHSIITLICRGRNLLDGTTTYGEDGCLMFHSCVHSQFFTQIYLTAKTGISPVMFHLVLDSCTLLLHSTDIDVLTTVPQASCT